MFPNQIILCQFLSLRLIRSCKKLLGTAQIFLISSLLLSSFGQGQVVAVDKTATTTPALNKNSVQEPQPFLSFGNDVDLKNLTRVYLDAHVAGYVSEGVAVTIVWPFKNASKVWAYAKKTFGSYGHDPHIYVFLCVNTTTQGLDNFTNSYATHLDEDYGFKNVLKMQNQSRIAWMKEANKTTEMMKFTIMVGNIVQYSSKNTQGSPGYNNYYNDTYRSSAWNLIFVYDVFLHIGMEQEAEFFQAADPSSPLTRNYQDIEETLDQDDHINWIKNWFWPIYLKYDGARALSLFITNCYSYFPKKMLKKTYTEAGFYYKYTKTMNKAEFVHFWSGSVGSDLRYLANFAFTWDLDDNKNFQSARKSYPMLKYQCNDYNCEKLPVLDDLVTSVYDNVPSNSEINKPRPAITVISEEKYSLEEQIRKRVKGTLYRPINQSEPYLYDGKNELYIFEASYGLCYYITCSAPYMIKWATIIPMQFNEYRDCPTANYLNSSRLLHKNEASEGQGQETLIQSYTIQFITLGELYESNKGLLECVGIQNVTQSTHIYLTGNRFDPDDFRFPPNIYVFELFWGHNSDKKLILPCKGTSQKIIPELRIRTKSDTDDYWTKHNTIWDKQNKILDAESHMYNLTYDPAIGFTFAYEIWPFDKISNTKDNLYFECFFKTKSRIRYKVYLTSEEKEVTSKLTIVDEEFKISANATGCILVKDSNEFIFVGTKTDLWNYPLKLISCSTPDACDLFRQCLDYTGKYCYSDQRKLQADYVKLKTPHNHGLFRCFDYHWDIQNKPIYEYTFVGLDGIRYVLSENFPKNAIIDLNKTPSSFYTFLPVSFTCQISTFVLMSNISFALVYLNETIVVQDYGNGRPQNQSLPFSSSAIGVYDNNDVSLVMNVNVEKGIGWKSINIKLTEEVVGVMCFALPDNSKEWVNATRLFVAKDIKLPRIQKDCKGFTRVFQTDEIDFNLFCNSNGVPDPEIRWVLPNTNPAIENKLVSNNSYLNFPPMEELFAGKYTCVATNPYGTDSYEFLLEYKKSASRWQEETTIIGFAVAFFVIISSLVYLLLKYRNASRQLRDLTAEEIKEFTHGKKHKLQPEGNIDISLLPFDEKYILNPKDLMIENDVVLGSGNFGIVHRGLLNGRPVAVKTLKSTADVSFVKGLLGELKIMSFIGDHDHVIHFFGAVIEKIQKRAVEAVAELSPIGDLKKYLKTISDSITTLESKFINLLIQDSHFYTNTTTLANQITTLTLVDWCRQIASGMNFIASKRVYHGDLAARNVLVFENNIVKLTDFGMSKQLYNAASYVKIEKIALPWRWMAIETLRFQEFSIESDVWAFGVTMWEIFSLGKFPFPGLNWTPEFMNILSTGMRMAKPEYCSNSVYDEMLKCWSEKPMDRPTFAQLVDFFERILEEHQTSSGYQQAKGRKYENEEENNVVYLRIE